MSFASKRLASLVVTSCRRAPALLERATWSDAEGNPLQLDPVPEPDGGAWQLVVTPSTDCDGWQYGSVFK